MAISFTPAEVDFLFPAPFHRRELLIYKLVKLFIGSVFMALFFSMSCLLYLNSWLSAFVGIFLTLVFTQLLALAVALAGQIVAEHAYTLTRKIGPARPGRARRGRAGPDALADSGPDRLPSSRGASGTPGPGA